MGNDPPDPPNKDEDETGGDGGGDCDGAGEQRASEEQSND